jgi:D-alanyl-D-alanine-carboxypeptidase/D-alanyl-D-alanine-endopeptidase
VSHKSAIIRILSLSLFGCFLIPRAARSAADEFPADAEIKQVLQFRIDTAKKGVGIVVGILDERGPRLISYGKTERGGGRDVDGDTVFEIGSVSKVFTSLALAQMVKSRDARLDDPLSRYLPAGVHSPVRNGREITLVDLATHTSGLPRLPDNLSPADDSNPYADYSLEQLYNFLSHYTLPREIGSDYEYSNYGAGLLGQLLALKAGTNYEAMILQKICRPLGLSNTVVTLSPDLKARLAKGYDEYGRPAKNWDFPTLAGAGGLRSTANDLLKFLAANLGLAETPLAPAMVLQQIPRHDADPSWMETGLGWVIAKRYGAEIVWHNGGTGGYHAFLGFEKKRKRGVVILANTANDIDDLGFHLLEPRYPLARMPLPKTHTAIQLDEKILDSFAGRYQLNPQMFFDVRREGDHLQIRLTGQDFLDILPESPSDFFCTAVDAQVVFLKDANGQPNALVLHQNGQGQKARKIR